MSSSASSSPPQELPFVTLDVFTTTRFQGNPLAIVRVPAKTVLPQETKQTIAREFNFSETVFLHEGGGREGTHPIDIFTTTAELPFAGHPTIGSAVYVLGQQQQQQGKTALLAKAGRILVERVTTGTVQGNNIVARASIPHDVHVHAGHLRTAASVETIRRSGALGYGSAAIEAAELDAPVVSIVKGMTFLLVRLTGLADLGKVRADGTSLDFGKIGDLLDEGPWNTGFVGRYYYVVVEDEEKTSSEGAAAKTTSVRTRMISDDIEDPATGSAASALASYLTLQAAEKGICGSGGGGGGELFRYNITQGVEMGRRSDILVEVQTKVKPGSDGTGGVAIETVYLGGSAVEVTRGTIRV